MHELTVIILVALATHRITRFIIADRLIEGPRERVQQVLERRWETKTGKQNAEIWGSKLAYLLGCPWCLGLWVAAATTVAADLTVGVTAPVLTALAASTVTGVLESKHG